jgi:Zn-dependent protease with chaperone function
MSFALRFTIVALTAFAVANVATSALAAWLAVRMQRRACPEPGRRAVATRRVRLLPVALGLAATVWTSLAFLVFEPRGQDERIGNVLVIVAGLTVVMLAASLWRLGHVLVRSTRALRPIFKRATPIAIDGVSTPAFSVDSAFPIVAVVGVMRPRLIIARSVLRGCSPDELGAILAHEHGHIQNHDNLTRLLMAVTPDLLSLMPASRRLAAVWHEAAEDAADDCATSLGVHGRALLAQALVKVARLVPKGAVPIILPASALYRGEDLERRVRRLLTPLAASGPRRLCRRAVARRVVTSVIVLAASASALNGIHELIEAAVSFFP